jgi:hypothetical protein
MICHSVSCGQLDELNRVPGHLPKTFFNRLFLSFSGNILQSLIMPRVFQCFPSQANEREEIRASAKDGDKSYFVAVEHM